MLIEFSSAIPAAWVAASAVLPKLNLIVVAVAAGLVRYERANVIYQAQHDSPAEAFPKVGITEAIQATVTERNGAGAVDVHNDAVFGVSTRVQSTKIRAWPRFSPLWYWPTTLEPRSSNKTLLSVL